jgi:hypothetical protein
LVIRWLSGPLRGFFNARFEAVHNEVRSVRILDEDVSLRVTRVEGDTARVVDAISTLRAELSSRDSDLTTVASVLGRDLERIREQMECSAEHDAQLDVAGIAVLPFIARALSVLDQGSRVLVVGSETATVGRSLAILGFDVTFADGIGLSLGAAAQDSHSKSLEELDGVAPFDGAVVTGLRASVRDTAISASDAAVVLASLEPLLAGGGVVALSSALRRPGEPSLVATPLATAVLLEGWQDVTVTHLERSAASRWTRAADVPGAVVDLVMASARKSEG